VRETYTHSTESHQTLGKCLHISFNRRLKLTDGNGLTSPPKVLDAFGQIGNPEKFGNQRSCVVTLGKLGRGPLKAPSDITAANNDHDYDHPRRRQGQRERKKGNDNDKDDAATKGGGDDKNADASALLVGEHFILFSSCLFNTNLCFHYISSF
jgi:hypothetical protein